MQSKVEHARVPSNYNCSCIHVRACPCTPTYLAFTNRDFDIEPPAEFYPFTYDLEAFKAALEKLPVSSTIPPGKGFVSRKARRVRACLELLFASCSLLLICLLIWIASNASSKHFIA
jgi:hypothetical protein